MGFSTTITDYDPTLSTTITDYDPTLSRAYSDCIAITRTKAQIRLIANIQYNNLYWPILAENQNQFQKPFRQLSFEIGIMTLIIHQSRVIITYVKTWFLLSLDDRHFSVNFGSNYRTEISWDLKWKIFIGWQESEISKKFRVTFFHYRIFFPRCSLCKAQFSAHSRQWKTFWSIRPFHFHLEKIF